MQKSKPSASQAPIQALANLLRTGQFELLIRQARDCAGRWPDSGPVWHLLGLAYLNTARTAEAITPLNRASKLMPGDAQILEHLAISQLQSGRHKEAYRSFEQCLALAPPNPAILINLAHLANELGQAAAAERHCREALRLSPGQAEVLFNLGRALRGQNRAADATAAFRQALTCSQNSPVAQNDIGLQLQALGNEIEAEACFRRAVALAPGYAPAHSNLGRLLEAQGRITDALAAFQRAVEADPRLAAVHANIGAIFNTLRQFTEAEKSCRRAIGLDPAIAAGFCNLGNALTGQRRYAEAETAYRQALKITPRYPEAYNNLGNLLQECKNYDEAITCYRRITDDDGSALGNAYHCANHLCDWSNRKRDEDGLRRALRDGTGAIGPFAFLAMPAQDGRQLQMRAGELYAQHQFRAILEQPALVARESRPTRDRLRIGYLSADFHGHATMHLLGGVLAEHDHERFAIHLYSHGPNCQDKERQEAMAAADVFRDVSSLSDEAAARQIAADGIDILVDLKGYTQDARLGITAWRPAPIIVSWLGYPGTLGHPRLADYILGDPVVTPAEHASNYTEAFALMPHCYQPNDRRREVGRRPARDEEGLPEQGFVFCSFNQSYKFNPETFDIWCEILQRVENSVLWLLKPSARAIANLRREAKIRGISPDRLLFAERRSLTEHLGRLPLADLALDTFPYGSHTTGSDALWAGVPMLTRTGDTFASRVGASLLHAVNLPELVTATWDDYLQAAVALASDPDRLAGLRARLAATRLNAPLFDTGRFTRDLEALYQQIWSHTSQPATVHASPAVEPAA